MFQFKLASLAEWAKKLPYFTSLDITDQVVLLQWSWPELLIGGFCHRSCAVKDGILLATGIFFRYLKKVPYKNYETSNCI